MKTFTINVTQEDIDNGDPVDACGCPIALAANRAMNRITGTDGAELEVYNGTECVAWAELPDVASKFVRDFDNYRPVSPLTFQIQIADL